MNGDSWIGPKGMNGKSLKMFWPAKARRRFTKKSALEKGIPVEEPVTPGSSMGTCPSSSDSSVRSPPRSKQGPMTHSNGITFFQILKELKSSMSMSSGSTTSTSQHALNNPLPPHPPHPSTAGPTSVFYVSATVESSTTEEEELDKRGQGKVEEEEEQQIPLLVRTGERSSAQHPHSSQPPTSAAPSPMGGNHSTISATTVLPPPGEGTDRLGTSGTWRELGSSRESWNEKSSSSHGSSRTSSSSNYHSESTFENSLEQVSTQTFSSSSFLLSPPSIFCWSILARSRGILTFGV